MNMEQPAVIWLYGGPRARARAGPLLQALGPQAAPLFLGPPGDPPPQLDLGRRPRLDRALETCPPRLRPRACLFLGEAPGGKQLECLPCPVLGWGGESGPEGRLPPQPGAAARELWQAAGEGFQSPWLERVQVNLPLVELLGSYRHLVEDLQALNLEIGLDARALDGLGPGDREQARRLLAGRRLSAHLPFIDLVPGSIDPLVAQTAQKRLLDAAQWALELGAGQAVAHLGFNRVIHSDRRAFCRRLAQGLAPLVEGLARGGCRLVLENVFEPDPAVCLMAREELARVSGRPVGLCLDLGHALAFSQSELSHWWRETAPHLGEVHLHDNHGGFDQHLPVGWGVVDWDLVGRGLARLQRPPVLTLEPHREAHLWASLRGLARVLGDRPRDSHPLQGRA